MEYQTDLTVDEIEYLRSALKESIKSKILKKLENIRRLKEENLALKTFLGMTNLWNLTQAYQIVCVWMS